MGNITNQFNADETTTEVERRVSEVKKYVIKKPGRSAKLAIFHIVSDIVEGEGVTKETFFMVLECSCCGALTSLDSDSKYKAPAGRCPNCKGLLCAKHVDDTKPCAQCGTITCPACRRTIHGRTDLAFCKKCFNKELEDANLDSIKTALLEKAPPSNRR